MTRCHAGKSGCFLCSYNSFYMFIMEVHSIAFLYPNVI